MNIEQINQQNQVNLRNSSGKLVEMQDLVSMYEQLGLKNEFLEALGNLALMTLEIGNFNSIKDLLLKYGLLEINFRAGEDKVQINRDESVN